MHKTLSCSPVPSKKKGKFYQSYPELRISSSDSKIKSLLEKLSMVVHTYNPSYLGGRGRKNDSSRPILAKLDPISKTKYK
jgi:hypothetical protein